VLSLLPTGVFLLKYMKLLELLPHTTGFWELRADRWIEPHVKRQEESIRGMESGVFDPRITVRRFVRVGTSEFRIRIRPRHDDLGGSRLSLISVAEGH